MTELVCRTDSSVRDIEAQVLECVERGGRYDIVPDRTVLYPGGGGQPADSGTMGGLPVVALAVRPDGAVVHTVESPLSGRVTISVDWASRFDNMQQHTAQHLMTAFAGSRLGWTTTSFHLNADRSDIEFELESVSPGDLGRLEDLVNDSILADLAVSISVVTREQMQSMNVRSRLLPDGFDGPFRLVGIEGVDLNTCGGTHVSSTGQLQIVKILGTEKLARGMRVFYAAGGRVRRIAGELLDREIAVGAALTTGPADFLNSIESLKAGVRDATNSSRQLRQRLAGLIVGDLLRMAETDCVVVHHEDEADSEFVRLLAEQFRQASPDRVAFLTAGVTEGIFILAGPEDFVGRAGPAVARILDGRGGGRGGVFQGRAMSLSLWNDAVSVLRGMLA